MLGREKMSKLGLRTSAALKLALALGGVAVFTTPALAQSATDALDDEIVVTATKRGDALVQDVPLAMTAYSAEQLQALNFQSLLSLTYTMPNVQLEDVGTSPGVANFSIRGLGINSSIPSVDPTVGVFVDGMYYGINAGVVVDNFDLEAVEVLRGPQGTLYGRNVTGGAVLIRTSEPSDEFRATGRIAMETGPEYIGGVVISGPLAPGLISGKLAVYHGEDEGWFTNDFDGSEFGASEMNIYRAALKLTPSENLEFLLRVEQGNSESDGPASQNHALFSRGSFDFSVNNRGYAKSDWEQAILEVNWDVAFGDGTITNIAGWRNTEGLTSGDIDATGTTLAPLTAAAGTTFHSRSVGLQDQFSNELRYAGTFGAVDVTAGLYWFQQDLKYIEERFLFAGLGGVAPLPAALCLPGPPGCPIRITRVGGGQGDFSTFGAFANADWHLTDEFSLNFGLRFTDEEKFSRVSRIRRGAGPLTPDNLDGAVLVPGEGVVGGSIDNRTLTFSDSPFDQSWNDTSPRIGFQWEPSDDTNLYGFWAQGFRSGGVNFRVTTINPPGGSGAPRAFDAEEQSSFELGLKQDFFDRRARVNVAVFHNTIDGMQRETNVPETGSGVQQVIVNAGQAVIKGAEMEARLRVTDDFTITAQVGYTDGEYDTVTADLNGDALVNAADLALEIPRLAPWTYGMNLIYDLPIAGGVLSSRVGYNHRDPAFYNDSNLGRLAEADIVDANFAYTPESGVWTLSLYGENLTDDVTWGGDTILPSSPAFGFTAGGPLATFSPLNEGRVIGAELRVNFGG
jgi:iron complex outermembrane recepter protein